MITLVAINAKFIHSSLAIRALAANMGELERETNLLEFTLKDSSADICESIAARRPRVIGLSVYIWNHLKLLEVIPALRELVPDALIVGGGPELAFLDSGSRIRKLLDCVVCGEGEVAFAQICRNYLDGIEPPAIFRAESPDLGHLRNPYHVYTDEDLKHRLTYVESSRGCPFSCSFCVSSIEAGVRYFPVEDFLSNLDELVSRGARKIKFLDRSFNVHWGRAAPILESCLAAAKKYGRDGYFVHFEFVPGRLPDAAKAMLSEFPVGTLRIEIGVQTLEPAVAARVHREPSVADIESMIAFFVGKTAATLHVDLIAGLPGESLDSFASGFDRLRRLLGKESRPGDSVHPAEIQIGILKNLPGTGLGSMAKAHEMMFAPDPPYAVVSSNTMSGEEIRRITIAAAYWEFIMNRNKFRSRIDEWLDSRPSAFHEWLRISDALFLKFGRTHSIDKVELGTELDRYLNKFRISS